MNVDSIERSRSGLADASMSPTMVVGSLGCAVVIAWCSFVRL
jgi:hypothetical protein